MTTVSDQQLAALAAQAGFTGDQIPLAVAIALAESQGNPAAHNTNAGTGDNSYGLWQINMLGSMGPARLRSFGLSSNEQLYDPATNALAAHQLFAARGSSFADWSTYKSGAYRQYLDRANSAAAGGGASLAGIHIPGTPWDIGNPLNLPGAAADSIAGALGVAVEPFVTGLRRLSIIGLAVAGGLALVVLGGWRGVKAAGG